jgi:hypothetical protein
MEAPQLCFPEKQISFHVVRSAAHFTGQSGPTVQIFEASTPYHLTELFSQVVLNDFKTPNKSITEWPNNFFRALLLTNNALE